MMPHMWDLAGAPCGGDDACCNKSLCIDQLNNLLPLYNVRIMAPPIPTKVPSNLAFPAEVPRFGFSILQCKKGIRRPYPNRWIKSNEIQ